MSSMVSCSFCSNKQTVENSVWTCKFWLFKESILDKMTDKGDYAKKRPSEIRGKIS